MGKKEDKFNFGFAKTKKNLMEKLSGVFSGKQIDDDTYDELMEALVLSDVSVNASMALVEGARKKADRSQIKNEEELLGLIKEEIKLSFKDKENVKVAFPAIILMVGVNGVGKTTTIAKLANNFKKENKSVMLCAADTFRAAASEQLSIWAKKLNVPIIRSIEGQDPSGVIFDALASAKAKEIDVLICDSAGRLQNKQNLMDELNKMYRVVEKNKGDYNFYSFLVLDAGAGQNSIVQAKSFNEVAPIDGLIMTKIDGSAKGGVLISLANEVDIPTCYVGVGEGIDDLEEFNLENYVNSIFEN